MKKQLTTLAILILSLSTQAQTTPFLGVSLHSKGYSLQVGMNSENIVVLAGYSKPLISAINPTLFFGNVGYEISLSQEEIDGYSLTPLIGISSFNYLDISKEEQIKGTAFMGGLELAKDFYMGRLYIHGNYSKGLFFGGGMKIFINR